jgi:hypothetical protein
MAFCFTAIGDSNEKGLLSFGAAGSSSEADKVQKAIILLKNNFQPVLYYLLMLCL